MTLLFLLAEAFAGPVLVDVLDVGQGDAVLVRGGGETVLIDAGDRDGPVVERLHALGVYRLDLVVATHPHADHIGEMADVLRTFEVERYVDNGMAHTTQTYRDVLGALAAGGVPRHVARAGDTFPLGDEATLTVLFPGEPLLTGTRSDLNSNSVVLRLDHGEVSVLLTGDAEAPTEVALVEGGLSPVDVLKVSHHGSAHSTTRRLLDAARPEVALISCGAANRYGHPAAETLERLRAAGVLVYRTDTQQTLRVASDGEGYTVRTGSVFELGPGLPTAPPALATVVEATRPEPAPPPRPETRKERRKRLKAERKAARQARRRVVG